MSEIYDYNYEFTKGNYRSYVRSNYLNYKKDIDYVNSNVISFTSTQGEDVGATILSCDIAVSHTKYNDNNNDSVWFAYITEEEGYIRIKQSINATQTKWRRNNIGNIAADKLTLAFNSDIAGTGNKYEFITDEKPYVAYIKNGAVYVLNLNDEILVPTLMVAENVTDISLVRAPKFIQNKNVDYGFILFFLMGNQLYYRQMIAGVWYDAELVDITFDSGTVLTGIEAFTTWDFRTGVLITTAAGQLLQLITYFEGLSNLMNEHIEMSMSANINLVPITYWDAKSTDEHIEMTMVASAKNIWARSVIPLSAQNLEDSSHNWGTTIQILFDYPVHSDGLAASMFSLVDEMDNNYVCRSFSISGEENRIITLTFDDFNLAGKWNEVIVSYTKPESGGLMSPAVPTESFSKTFEPINLIPPLVDPPAFARAKNKGDMKIVLTLTEPYTNSLTGMAEHFSIGCQEYNYVPNGTLQNTDRVVTAVEAYGGLEPDLNDANLTDTEIYYGAIVLEVEDS